MLHVEPLAIPRTPPAARPMAWAELRCRAGYMACPSRLRQSVWRCRSSLRPTLTEEVEKHIDSFARAETWRDALIRYGLYGPPSGVFESNRDAVEEIAREAPLISLIAKQVVGQHMAPILKAGTEEERRDLDLTEYEALQLRAWAPIAAEIVHRIRVRHGTPERGELVDFFVTDAIDVATADRVADAVLRFWEGDYDAAAHVLVPRLEAIIRSLCLRAGIVVIREPVGANPGGVVGLGALLDDLNGRLDESWRRYLVNLLAEVVGLNL